MRPWSQEAGHALPATECHGLQQHPELEKVGSHLDFRPGSPGSMSFSAVPPGWAALLRQPQERDTASGMPQTNHACRLVYPGRVPP